MRILRDEQQLLNATRGELRDDRGDGGTAAAHREGDRHVRAERGDGKVNLFTMPEWDNQKDAAWSMCEAILSYKGSTGGIAEGATFSNLDDCEERIEDGWEDGSPGRTARFVEDET